MNYAISYAAALLAMTVGAQAYTTHCQRNGGPVYACHICTRGHNAMTLTEYECSAKAERRQMRRLPGNGGATNG
jgi:hypothetical protein